MKNVVDIPGSLIRNLSDKHFFNFIEYFPSAVLLLDEKLIIKAANNLSVSIFGYNDKEIIIGKNIIEFVSEKDKKQFEKNSLFKPDFSLDNCGRMIQFVIS